MPKSSLCDYSDEHILTSGTITIIEAGPDVAVKRAYEGKIDLIFKNCHSKKYRNFA